MTFSEAQKEQARHKLEKARQDLISAEEKYNKHMIQTLGLPTHRRDSCRTCLNAQTRIPQLNNRIGSLEKILSQ